jgi:hypothetical protein
MPRRICDSRTFGESFTHEEGPRRGSDGGPFVGSSEPPQLRGRLDPRLAGVLLLLGALLVAGALDRLGALRVAGALERLGALRVEGALGRLGAGALRVDGALDRLGALRVAGALERLGALRAGGALDRLGTRALGALGRLGALRVSGALGRLGAGALRVDGALFLLGALRAGGALFRLGAPRVDVLGRLGVALELGAPLLLGCRTASLGLLGALLVLGAAPRVDVPGVLRVLGVVAGFRVAAGPARPVLGLAVAAASVPLTRSDGRAAGRELGAAVRVVEGRAEGEPDRAVADGRDDGLAEGVLAAGGVLEIAGLAVACAPPRLVDALAGVAAGVAVGVPDRRVAVLVPA